MTMDDRKSKILQAIIEDYVATAEPIGSRTIARKFSLGVSPATIRNEMSDLEELGYLEQPHASAGRVPSDRGYRYYVDCLMESREVTSGEDEIIRRTFERKAREVDTLVRETARLLSETTNLTAVVSGPQMERAHFKDLRIVPIGPGKAVLIYMTDSGFVENQVLELPVEVTMLELQKFSDVLTEQLRGQPVETLSKGAIRSLQQELRRYGALLEQALHFLNERMEPGDRQRVFMGGATHMLGQPEFRNVDKARNLLSLLERDDVVTNLLSSSGRSEALTINIGEEIKIRDMAECSVVSATYRLGDEVVGRMGVIGPKRMDYGRVVSIMNAVSRHFSENLQKNR
jgi:heat-inducible transcriptional repressor